MLELGAGTGLSSLVAAIFAKQVIVTGKIYDVLISEIFTTPDSTSILFFVCAKQILMSQQF